MQPNLRDVSTDDLLIDSLTNTIKASNHEFTAILSDCSDYEMRVFCKRFNPTREDIIVILGDVGANYGQDERDAELKYALNKLKPTIFCIHGNHEIRPWHIPTYKAKEWHGGIVWYEEAYG